MKHQLNSQTKEVLRNRLGVSYDEIQRMSAVDLDVLVERRIGKKLKPAFSLRNMVNRGSIYLFFKRLTSMSDVDNKLSKI